MRGGQGLVGGGDQILGLLLLFTCLTGIIRYIRTGLDLLVAAT